MNDLSLTRTVRRVQRPFRLICTLILSLGFVLALLLALTAVTEPVYAGTLCVKPGGGDGCETTINDALNMAQPGDTILVAAGEYIEYVVITQTVTLQGGWAPDFSARDLSHYTSTIKPPINMVNPQSVVSIQGQFADPTTVAPTLDGFEITEGRADLGSNHGGGLRITGSDAVVISNTIRDNRAFLLGGGIWVQNGAPHIEGNRIENNLSDGLGQEAYGGGVQLENAAATLLNNIIAHNVVSGTESSGGGIDVFSGDDVLLAGNDIFSNTINNSNGFGGGISVRDATVNISGTTVTANWASDEGGGIYVSGGTVTVTATILSGNQATYGAGLSNYAEKNESSVFLFDTVVTGNGTDPGPNIAAGLRNVGSLQGKAIVEMTGSQVTNNTANAAAGVQTGSMDGGEAVMVIAGSAITGNTATFDVGGITNASSVVTSTRLTIMDSLISGNMARNAGGIANLGILTLTQATVNANVATDHGGGLYNTENARVTTADSLLCNNVADSDADAVGDGGGIYNFLGEITLTDSTVCGNAASTFGGGIFSNGVMTITTGLLSDNSADDGGAIFVEDAASLTTILSSTLDQNIARQSAGAINNSGMLAVTASTFSGNTAEQASAGAILNNGETTLINVTLSGNTAGGFGGALRNLDTLTMTGVTISDNEALTGAGIYNDQDTWLVNTILADNTGANCGGNPLTSLGNNLEDGDSCNLDLVLDDLIDTDPLLGPLADNGGDTQTHALLTGSPAIDAGHNAAAACPPTDQRGVPRPIDGDGDGDTDCDIGAFEVQLATTTAILSDAPDPSAPGEPFTVTVSVASTLGTPTGAVTVTASGDPQSCHTILVGGMGNCALALSVSGSYTLTAAYGGDGTYAPSSASEAHAVDTISNGLYLPLVMR